MNKMQMRDRLKRHLHRLTVDQRHEKSARACELLVSTSAFQAAQVVMMFLSLPEEVDTTVALAAAWHMGKTVLVPRICSEDHSMEAVVVESLDDEFEVCSLGVRYPRHGQPMPVEQIDLVVAPALGYDGLGQRLGRGGAYYDRFFRQARLRARRYGLAFEEQVVDAIPTVDHDQLVDCVITDERVIIPDNQRNP